MAREGIYIGGREIVERYVGDKLVWEKWKYLNSFKTILKGSFYGEKNQLFLPCHPVRPINGQFNTGDKGKTLVKYSNYSVSGSVIVKKVFVYGDPNSGHGYDALVIEFYTEKEAKEFNNYIKDTTTLEIYN